MRVEDGGGAAIASYYYDPFGRRLWKEVGGVRTIFHYADEGLVGEYDASGTVIKTYGYQPDGTWTTDPLFMKEGDNYYFYHNDHLGTPVAMTDVNGAVVWNAQYNSIGKAVVDMTATAVNNLRFPGQYYDEETGLHYNWNRYYDPSTGRYVTTDPIGFEGGVNLYAYVDNNPTNYFDPNAYGKIGAVIKLGRKAWKHITKRHVARNIFKNKSKFKDPSSIKKGINKTIKNPDRITKQTDGRILYEKDFGKEIGTKGETVQRVIVDKYGNVITSFPSKAYKATKINVPGAALGTTILGDNIFGQAADFFNPLSDLQDIIDLFQSEEDDCP